MALDPESATLGLPMHIETKHPVNADHSAIAKIESRSMPVFTTVLERLREMLDLSAAPRDSSSSQKAANPVHSTVISCGNPLFTGRGDTLSALERMIRDAVAQPVGQHPRRIVISGMGGIGKSEVCLQLIHRVDRL